jgi:outer membrane protein OmpA-like peptidoglycan-associated protein
MKYLFTIAITFLFASNSFGIVIFSSRVYFEFDSYQLTTNAKESIDKKIENLKTKKNIYINGYTDNIGDTLYNRVLSQSRANSVKIYLIAKGVPSKSIQFTVGQGESNIHELNHKNRYVDITTHDLGTVINQEVECKTDNTNIKIDSNVTVVSQIQSANITLDKITTLEIGQTLTLENLNFIPGRHFLLEGSESSLKELVKIIKDNPALKIEIQGHICCTPSGGDGMDQDTHTMNLSINRAQYIYNYLIESDISPYRLSFKGFGASKPLVKEITEADRIKNRRVEIMIIEK